MYFENICNRCLFGTFGYIIPNNCIDESITDTPNGNAAKQFVKLELVAYNEDNDA